MKNALNEVYVSTDIEADGPIPGPHSMLSLGSVAYAVIRKNGRLEKVRLGDFSANLELLPGSEGNPDTMAWWAKQPEAWEACRKNLETPSDAMHRYYEWITKLPGITVSPHGNPGNAVFVGYPAGFDFLFVYWYLMTFVKVSPFSFSAIDIKTYAMARLRTSYRQTTKKAFPKRWFPEDRPHTHVAVEDAEEQGELFMNILIENLSAD